MTPYDKFIQTISTFSNEIKIHSQKSWLGINLGLSEPEIIKQYLMSPKVGVDYLNENISKLVSGNSQYQIKFASVFTHQKPRIERTVTSKSNCVGNTDQCEIGDLLLIFCFIDRNKTVKLARAHLVQAKKDYVLSSASQKCLYENDLDFMMPQNIADKSINPNRLRVLPTYATDRIHSLSYLILNSTYPLPSLRQIPWSSNMEYGYENFLHRFMIGDIGKPFVTPTPTSNDWDCIIDDLINVGTGKVASSTSRGAGLKFVLDSFNYFFFYDEYKMELENPGLPSIYVIVQDTELNEE